MSRSSAFWRVVLWVGLAATSLALSPSAFHSAYLARPSVGRSTTAATPASARRQHHGARRASALNELFEPGPGESSSGPRFVFVGGKGGVGKTSTTAALAVRLADAGLRCLVVSTDPAHSLGDALALGNALCDAAGAPVRVEGPGDATGGSLDALEVDSEAAMAQLGQALAAFDVTDAAREVGGQAAADFVDKLGLKDFAAILEKPPPGVDELVALSDVLKFAKQGAYDRVLVDTAPTGHTLRLLSLPKFLDDFLERLIALRKKMQGATGFLGNFGLGGGGGGEGEAAEASRDRLREFQVRMYALEDLLTDPTASEFVVVTVPTELAVAESERLVTALAEEQIAVNHLVLNQVLRPEVIGAGAAGPSYVDRLRSGQASCAAELHAVAASAPGGPLTVTTVPWLDTEARGVYGLRALGQALLK